MRKIIYATVLTLLVVGIVAIGFMLNVANGTSVSSVHNGNVTSTDLNDSLNSQAPVAGPNGSVIIASGKISNVSRVLARLFPANQGTGWETNSSSVAGGKGPGPLISLLHTTSQNWAGYQVYNSTSSITDVVGTWKVQPAGTSANTSYSNQWIGDGGGGAVSGDKSLIQIGTESDYSTILGRKFFAWWQLNITNSESRFSSAFTISSGDVMVAQIYLVSGSTWNLTLIDETTSVGYYELVSLTSQQVPSRKYAEWIVERPTEAGSLPALTDFGTSDFGPVYTSAGSNYAGINSLYSKDIGNWPNGYEYNMTNTAGTKTLAYPSSLSSDQQSFVVTRTANQAP